LDTKKFGDEIVAEINRNLEAIRWSNSEIHDKYAAGTAKMLVDLLDNIDEVKSEEELRARLEMMRMAANGAVDVLDNWIEKMKRKS